ncbi:MAG: CRISPR associated protein, RAMP family Cas5 group [Candidatus Methanohalarchaeum thermophilum]|uniref:CRISPR associated protein, RAMP family Cas5 group n=1 Tax=Methanohalarchaeum thermophilum TaxID=1903181 RepID=A0A1Q6DWS4_METT1|nr:MAG: CRISPR associated protein, RAMP family Cas5 group [Candidatus Methanohalarchaeum thermophilum]
MSISVKKATIEVKDPVYFSGKEMNKRVSSGRYLHNYALTYSILNASGNFSKLTEYTKKWEKPSGEGPKYKEDLRRLNFYVFPAKPVDINFSTEIVNTTSEEYHEEVTARRGKRFFTSHKLQRIDIGSKFETFILSREEFDFPSRTRLGKFMSKVRLKTVDRDFERENTNTEKKLTSVLNAFDLSEEFEQNTKKIKIKRMRPTPLITSAVFNGDMIVTEEGGVLPLNVGYLKKKKD